MFIGTQRFDVILKRLLQSLGDLFAFKPEPSTGAEGSLFSAIAEYCDNDTSLKAVSQLNNTLIDVSLQSIYLWLPLT